MKYRDRIVGLIRVRGDRILPHPKNFRGHPENQRDAMRGALADVGIGDALIVVPTDEAKIREVLALKGAERDAWLRAFDAGGADVLLLDGHLRAEEIRDQPIPVLVLDLLPHEQAEFLALFDPIGDLATFDRDRFLSLADDFNSTNASVQALVADLAKIQTGMPEFGLEGDGATAGSETGNVTAGEDEEEPVIPTDALIEKWGTAPGQLWVVPSLTVPGREHRLLCGDCRDPANVARLRDGRIPVLGLHDPPYGINAVGIGFGNGKLNGNSTVPRGRFAPIVDDEKPFEPSHLLGSAPKVVLWGANHYADKLPASAEWIVWDKRDRLEVENAFSDAELAWSTQPKGKTGHIRTIRHTWNGYNRASERGEKRLHPTQKPVFVQGRIVEWHSEPGNDVEDWYMGAGAVIIACEQTGRIGHGMDIAHAYLAATLERLSQRGLTPRLAA